MLYQKCLLESWIALYPHLYDIRWRGCIPAFRSLSNRHSHPLHAMTGQPHGGQKPARVWTSPSFVFFHSWHNYFCHFFLWITEQSTMNECAPQSSCVTNITSPTSLWADGFSLCLQVWHFGTTWHNPTPIKKSDLFIVHSENTATQSIHCADRVIGTL